MIRAALHRALLLLFLLGGCNRVTIAVEVEGIPRDMIALQVNAKLSGRAGVPASQVVTQRPFSFLLELPAEAMGTLVLQVSGQDSVGCTVAQGSVETELAAGSPSQINVRLDPVPICVVFPSTIETATSIGGSGPADVWVLGERKARHWDGATWDFRPFPKARSLQYIWGSNPNDIWAISLGEIVHWDGKDWSDGFISGGFAAIWGSGPNDVWALGTVIPCAHWNGTAWAPVPFTRGGSSIWGSGPNDVWAVGGYEISHWDGKTWSATAGFHSSHSIWGSGPNDVWAVGNNTSAQALILHWNGMSWTPFSFPSPINGTLWDVWGSGPNDVWAVGDQRTDISDESRQVMILHWDGVTWAPVPLPSPIHGTLYSMWGSEPNYIWTAGVGILRIRLR